MALEEIVYTPLPKYIPPNTVVLVICRSQFCSLYLCVDVQQIAVAPPISTGSTLTPATSLPLPPPPPSDSASLPQNWKTAKDPQVGSLSLPLSLSFLVPLLFLIPPFLLSLFKLQYLLPHPSPSSSLLQWPHVSKQPNVSLLSSLSPTSSFTCYLLIRPLPELHVYLTDYNALSPPGFFISLYTLFYNLFHP